MEDSLIQGLFQKHSFNKYSVIHCMNTISIIPQKEGRDTTSIVVFAISTPLPAH